MEILLLIVTLLPILSGLCIYFLRNQSDSLRADFANIMTIIEFALCLYLFVYAYNGNELIFKIDSLCGFTFQLYLDGFRALYVTIAALMWMMTTLFTKEYFAHYKNKVRYMFFTLLTFGATLGVFLSADFMTLFIYFEIMSVASYVMVIHDQNEQALDAGNTYIVVAICGGMIMLMGLFILYSLTQTLEFSGIFEAVESLIHHDESKRLPLFISGLLMLTGFGAKAGLYPLHIWLPKAYPVAPAPASALLSGILSKTGVYGMLIVSIEIFREDASWAMIILVLGVITMLLGAILAVFSTNLKRTLACSSMSQIGFISVGLAMCIFLGHHNALAARGTILHMVNHSLIKLLLFMIAGVIYMNIHKLDLNDIQGYGKNKPLLKILFLIGALGIAGIPMFNGYVSKTLIHESIVEYIHICENVQFFTIVEWLFIIAGGLTLAYMTKLFVCIFIEDNANKELQKQYDSQKHYMNKTSSLVLIICSLLLILIGCIPNITADRLADMSQSLLHAGHLEHAIHYFSSVNLIGGLKSIVIGIIVYVMIRFVFMKDRQYLSLWPKWLDMEQLLYKPLIIKALPFVCAFIFRLIASISEFIVWLLNKTILESIDAPVENPSDYERGTLQVFTTHEVIDHHIESSLSFGLLIAGLGIALAMAYILIAFHVI